jgi:transglutaminase-like putative cysteine protease
MRAWPCSVDQVGAVLGVAARPPDAAGVVDLVARTKQRHRLTDRLHRTGGVPAEDHRRLRRSGVEQVVGGRASHAWAEVFAPGAGWIGIDPTLGALASGRHIRVAYGRDYGDVPPVRGVYRGQAGQRLSVNVLMRPAIDDDGCEHLRERVEPAAPEPPPESLPQQQQQQ